MNHYVTVYSTVFAVMFNVMVFISYELGAFKIPSLHPSLLRILGFGVAILLVVFAPVLFFVHALTVIEKISEPLNVWTLLRVLYWVTPVYGFQQFWLLIAWVAGWVQFHDYTPGRDWIWWLIAFVVFALIPAWRLFRSLRGEGLTT